MDYYNPENILDDYIVDAVDYIPMPAEYGRPVEIYWSNTHDWTMDYDYPDDYEPEPEEAD